MGMYSARKGLEILDNVRRVLAIEMLLATQGLDFSKPLSPGAGTRAAYEKLREEVPYLEKDGILYPLIDTIICRMKDRSILEAVEGVTGELE